jgi:putative redox protein
VGSVGLLKENVMVKSKAVYEGELHCTAAHEPSGSKVETDAPKDNQGRGERFSPTDLVGAALTTCILTTMDMVARRDGHSIQGATATVEKEMVADPLRRIGALRVQITLPASLSPEMRKKLEHTAQTCPVHRSLHPEMQKPMEFRYV